MTGVELLLGEHSFFHALLESDNTAHLSESLVFFQAVSCPSGRTEHLSSPSSHRVCHPLPVELARTLRLVLIFDRPNRSSKGTRAHHTGKEDEVRVAVSAAVAAASAPGRGNGR